MPRAPISEIRLAIADAIVSIPAYGSPPDDVTHIPCAVVGPPRMELRPSLGGLWDLEYSVLIIGRRYDFQEVHTELDDAAWAVIGDLETASNVIPGLRATGSEPMEVNVAGHLQPAHQITVTATATYCF